MTSQNSLNKTSDTFTLSQHLTVGNAQLIDSIPFGGGALGVKVLVDSEGFADLGGVVENRHTNVAGLGSNFILSRTRGTHAAPTVVQTGDNVGRVASLAYDGTEFVESAEIRYDVTGTVAAGKTPGQLVLSTADDATGAIQTAMTISNAQIITLAKQPAVVAYMTNTVNNVTGDSTAYTVIFDTETLDRGGNYNLGTGTFTAPVTGLYMFTVQLTTTPGLYTNWIVELVGPSNVKSAKWTGNSSAADGAANWTTPSLATHCYLSAADTVTVRFTVTGGAKDVDIIGGQFSKFTAELVG